MPSAVEIRLSSVAVNSPEPRSLRFRVVRGMSVLREREATVSSLRARLAATRSAICAVTSVVNMRSAYVTRRSYCKHCCNSRRVAYIGAGFAARLVSPVVVTYDDHMDANSEITDALASRLRAERAAAGLTQAQAADAVGISMRTLIRYERGEREVPMALFIMLANAYGADAGDMLDTAVSRAEGK